MKFLENSTFDGLSSTIGINAIDCMLDVKIEAYSCKMVQSDKKQWKADKGDDRQPLSPPDDTWLVGSPMTLNGMMGHRMRHLSEPSCSGSEGDGDEPILLDSISRRTLFDLIGVLNVSYPDYDFNNVKSQCFSLVGFDDVMSAVDSKLETTVFNYRDMRDELWSAIEGEINPRDARIYRFNSTYNDDPFSEDGVMWCFNYIVHNKALKRLLFLSCRALSKTTELDMSAEQMWDVDDDEE